MDATKKITRAVEKEIRQVIGLDISTANARALLNDIADRHGLKKYAVRGAHRILLKKGEAGDQVQNG